MQSHLAEKDVKGLLDRLKQEFKSQPEGTRSLDIELESAAKHVPAYLKIVKGHIEQLAKVLELETHNHRNLESVGLAEPVTQLIQLFRELDEADLQLLEELALEARTFVQDHEAETLKPAALAAEA